MSDIFFINAEECYKQAENKAANYFKILFEQVHQKSFIPILTKDFQLWKPNHISRYSRLSNFINKRRRPSAKDYHSYIRWLNYTGRLEAYLERSISYIYMRDLGKALDMEETKLSIKRTVEDLKHHLIRYSRNDKDEDTEELNTTWLYRKAQKEGIEDTMIWVINKLMKVSSNIPEGMDKGEAERKLIKIIAGVVMHVMDKDLPPEDRTLKLDEAVRLGYSYGLTYPFIDDLLDASVLSDKEKSRYSDLIRTTLTTGSVPDLGEWSKETLKFMGYVHSELKEAFEYIKSHQKSNTQKSFFEQSFIFFNSQETDRAKELSNINYTNEDIYIPIILKSSYSRLIARSVLSSHEDEGFDNRTFYYGIYNQLADDFADMFDDLKDGAVTPYTYYVKYHEKRRDLINPFELYWGVISNLIHNVYQSDPKVREVILDRAINGLKRCKARLGTKAYNELMDLFTSFNPEFNRLVQKMVDNADDVDFFDKLLRDHMITSIKKEQEEQEAFIDTMKAVRERINDSLPIPEVYNDSVIDSSIIEAANYCLKADGKRLRPLIAWIIGVKEFELDETAIAPLLRSMEYMHTASLIFDDLPSQDNASIRRGRPTLHQVYNISTAELTALFLTQRAVEEQTSLEKFDMKSALKLISYSAHMTQEMCRGQTMDLNSRNRLLTPDELNLLCYFKTGIAFEASIVMPAILANRSEAEIKFLKEYAHHTGIAFQIKDDLLDADGDPALLGKPTGKDMENKNSTFVTILGYEKAERALWEHYCKAEEALAKASSKTSFLKRLLNYVVFRDH